MYPWDYFFMILENYFLNYDNHFELSEVYIFVYMATYGIYILCYRGECNCYLLHGNKMFYD